MQSHIEDCKSKRYTTLSKHKAPTANVKCEEKQPKQAGIWELFARKSRHEHLPLQLDSGTTDCWDDADNMQIECFGWRGTTSIHSVSWTFSL